MLEKQSATQPKKEQTMLANGFIQEEKTLKLAEVLPLYESVGWANYTKNPSLLELSLQNSLTVLCFRLEGKLLGLLRAVGDGYSVLYVQDLLVLPENQRMGIGKALLKELVRLYPKVYQKVLLTDDTPENARFYEGCGFMPASIMGCTAYVKIAK